MRLHEHFLIIFAIVCGFLAITHTKPLIPFHSEALTLSGAVTFGWLSMCLCFEVLERFRQYKIKIVRR